MWPESIWCPLFEKTRFGIFIRINSIMGTLKTRACRIATTVACLLAWFVVSKHCALAVIEDMVKPNAETAQPCSHCASEGKGKSAPVDMNACCKGMKVTLESAKPFQVGNHLLAVVVFVAVIILEPSPVESSTVSASDTGPPGVHSFAEIVLQRSLLAHAPPAFV